MATIVYYDAMGRGADMRTVDSFTDVYDGPGFFDDLAVELWDFDTWHYTEWYDGGDLFLSYYVVELFDPIYLLEDMYAFDFFGRLLASFEGVNVRINITENFADGVNVSSALTGSDYVEGNNYSDYLNGFSGNDELVGLGGHDTLNGGLGNDDMYGGIGDDLYFVNSLGDRVFEAGFSGVDLVSSSVSYALPLYVENLVLTGSALNGWGSKFANVVVGSSSNNYVSGEGGNDIVAGEGGNDRVAGGAGRDTVSGGIGFDVFHFQKASESGASANTRDTISDFVRGVDLIDLSPIDANSANGPGTNERFGGFIGSSVTFSRPGQLKFVGGVLYGNTDNDGAAEFSIQLSGISALAVADLIL